MGAWFPRGRVFFFVALFLILPTLSLLSSMVSPGVGWAIDLPASAVTENPSTPTQSGQSQTLFVTKKNLSSFQELLIAPIATWVQEGKIVLPVAKKIEFNWESAPSWTEATRRNYGAVSLGQSGELLIDNGIFSGIGFPFGGSEELDSETDLVRKAYKILWNRSFAEAQVADILYGVEVSWVGNQALLRQSNGILFRNFRPQQLPTALSSSSVSSNAAFSSAMADKQTKHLFFRECFRLLHPPVVFGYAQVAERHLGAREDDVWLYSPVVGKSRQVFPANRSDSILQGALTFDDMFVWSTKVQAVNARVVDEKVLLLPFPSRSIVRLQEEAIVLPAVSPLDLPESSEVNEKVNAMSGLYQTSTGKPSTMVWNFDSRRFSQLAPWMPTEIVFVPRDVWILELSPKDAYYSDGRQIVVIDKISMLPIYKVVYNRSGGYHRTIIGAWSLASTEDGSVRFPFNAFVLAVEYGGQSGVAVSHNYIRTFLGKKTKAAEELRALLDISHHGKKEEDVK